jgi:inner membrane protein
LEPITHLLTGACIGRAVGLNRRTLYGTLTCVLAAEAADLDMVTYLKSPVFGFAHHRGITHSFVGVPFVAAAVVLFIYVLWRFRHRGANPTATNRGSPSAVAQRPATNDQRPATVLQPRWGLLYGFACVAALSHILLDYTNSYGVRPFEPFSYRWYSWDIVFIFEPLLYIALLGGLLLPSLFGLINDEIGGGRRRTPRGRTGATVALVAVVAIWGLRDYQHRRAVAALEARLYHQAEPLRVSAYPYYLNPFKWYGVVETDAFYEQVPVDSLTPEVDPHGQAYTRFKHEETPASEAAKASYLGRVYLDWAQYPIAEVESTSDPAGYLVRFYDLRFDYPDLRRRGGRPLGARVQLDGQLHVIGQYFGARQQRPDLLEPNDDNRR